MGMQDFTLTNSTGVPIHHVYVSAADDDNWEDDILGRDVLMDGESVDISFDVDAEQELWDIKIDDEDGNEIFWKGMNLSEISEITLHWDGSTATAQTA